MRLQGARFVALAAVRRILLETSLFIADEYQKLSPGDKMKLEHTSASLAAFAEEEQRSGGRVVLTLAELCKKIGCYAFVDEGRDHAMDNGAAQASVQGAMPERMEDDEGAMIAPTPLPSWKMTEKTGGLKMYQTFANQPVLVDASTSFIISLGMSNKMGYICQGDILGKIGASKRAVVVCVGQRVSTSGGALSLFVADLDNKDLADERIACKMNIIAKELFVDHHIMTRCSKGELKHGEGVSAHHRPGKRFHGSARAAG